MNRLNEKQIIKIFQKGFGNKKFASEDVEVIRFGKNEFVSKIDTLVESTDVPKGMSISDAARKAIVACVSDFASKGVKPTYGVVSVTIPKKLSKKKIMELIHGLSNGAKEFGIKILGGDTNEGIELVITICLFGTSKKIVLRKGAKNGDLIITTGPFGYTKAGLQIMQNKKKAANHFRIKSVQSIIKPTPRLKFGLSNCRYFSSSMDSSDGLSTTLHEMAKQSNKKFVVTNLPTNTDVLTFAQKNRLNHFDLILNGGEEYEIIATVSRQNFQKIKNYAKKQKIQLFEIGFVTNGKGVVHNKNNKTVTIRDMGWKHLQG